jgi:RNase H-like domain found in reverse transcriptase
MDLSSNMDGCMVFSKIDLVKAFHQVPIAPEDHQKTAFITPFGLFELLKGKDLPKLLPWEECHDAAFASAKAALVVAVPLAHPLPDVPLALATDTSDTHVGGVLQ